MILDQLSQWRRYAPLHPYFSRAFSYLATLSTHTPPGRYDLQDDDLFVIVQSYPTKTVELCRFEAHREYADIQFIIAGCETIHWTPLVALTKVTEPYNAAKDIAFYGWPAGATPLHLTAGQFAVFYPEDGHAPGGGQGDVLKAVVKVRVESL